MAESASLSRPFKRGSEVEIGERIVETLEKLHGKVVATEGALFYYNKYIGLWESEDYDSLISRAATYDGKWIEYQGKEGPVKRPIKLAYNHAKGAASAATHIRRIVKKEFFNTRTQGIAFKNKFIKLEGGECIPVKHSPEHRVRFGVPFDWNPDAPLAAWQNFLDSIFLYDVDRAEKQMFLQEFVGMCLAGLATTQQQCAFLFGAAGENGKSTFIETVRQIFHKDATTAIDPKMWNRGPHVARLAGVLMNTCNELKDYSLMESGIIKGVIAGDTTTGDPKYIPPFTFAPIAGHLFSANSMPKTSDSTEAFWRRFVVVRFGRSFKKGDPAREDPIEFKKKLSMCLQGIAVWAAQGAARCLAQGQYTIPQSAQEFKDMWREEADSVAGWCHERTAPVFDLVGEERTKVEDRWTQASVLQADYRDYCDRTGKKEQRPNDWARSLHGQGIRKVRVQKGVYWAITLKSPTKVHQKA